MSSNEKQNILIIMLNKSYIILHIDDSFIKSILRLNWNFSIYELSTIMISDFGFMNFFSYYVKLLRLYMLWAFRK